jgi:predicted GIY-YIG superfamily endonuclease
MPFSVYMLRCSDGSFYVGHTDNLENRIAAHQSGATTGYTQTRRPVSVVFVESFSTRVDALERERQIKGWRRAKKEALVAGDWDRLPSLARGSSRAAPIHSSFDKLRTNE